MRGRSADAGDPLAGGGARPTGGSSLTALYGPVGDDGMRDGWRDPHFNLAYLLLLVGLVPLPLERYILHDPVTTGLYVASVLWALVFIAPILVMRWTMRERWHSEYRAFTADTGDAMAVVEDALRKGGYAPVAREQGTLETVWTTDVRGGLNVKFESAGDKVVIYVGPVTDESRRDVTAIEGLIDVALSQTKEQIQAFMEALEAEAPEDEEPEDEGPE